MFIKRTILVTSLVLIPWFSEPPTPATGYSPEADMPAQKITQVIPDAPLSHSNPAPAAGVALVHATWVDDIISALGLGMYFNANYPTYDFAPYLKKLTSVRDAVGRGDRQTVRTEMGAFFTMLDKRANGISEAAADELTNFTRMIMPTQEYGSFFPKSAPEQP